MPLRAPQDERHLGLVGFFRRFIMLFNHKLIKAVVLMLVLSLASQIRSESENGLMAGLTKNTAFGISAGAGFLGLCGKLAWDKFKNSKTIGMKEMLWGSFCGLFLGGITCAVLLPQSVEWQEQKEQELFESFCSSGEKKLEEAKLLTQNIRAKLPRVKEDIRAYAARVYKESWSLCLADKNLNPLREQVVKIHDALVKQQEEITATIMPKFTSSKFNIQGFKSRIDALVKELPALIASLNAVIGDVTSCIKEIQGHSYYAFHCEQHELEQKIAKYDELEADLKNITETNARLRDEDKVKFAQIRQLQEDINKLRLKFG